MHTYVVALFKVYLSILGWIHDHRLCKRFGLVFRILAKYTWLAGYIGGYRDIRANQACHLRANTLLWIERDPFFRPATPTMYAQALDLLDIWDEGYERAITVHRLGFEPRELLLAGHPLADPRVTCGVLEHVIDMVLSGDYAPSPESFRWSNGRLMPAMNKLQNEQAIAYRHYSEAYQQITAACTPDCTAELEQFTRNTKS